MLGGVLPAGEKHAAIHNGPGSGPGCRVFRPVLLLPRGSGARPQSGMEAHNKVLLTATVEVAKEVLGLLRPLGCTPCFAPPAGFRDALRTQEADAVLIDLSAEDAAALVSAALQSDSQLPLVVIASDEQLATAIDAVRAGALDYLRRPLQQVELRVALDKARALTAGDDVRSTPSGSAPITLLGRSGPMRTLQTKLRRAARSEATVLVQGESGTGKELVARHVHRASRRQGGPFVKVHCGALPDNLLESELFGYEKGAFTGATTRKPGRVELAQGGTLFLDEIGDISAAMQVKLLRVLQDKEYERLGGTETLRADVRFVAATHRDLGRMAKAGDFREDLYYRLNVIRLVTPPLRSRGEDVVELAQHFLDEAIRSHGVRSARFAPEALKRLRRYAWPGNVRQLQNLVERLVVLGDGEVISAEEVKEALAGDGRYRAGSTLRSTLGTHGHASAGGSLSGAAATHATGQQSSVVELEVALRLTERRALEKALKRAGGNRNQAARLLGVSRRKLFYMLREHELS